MGFKATVTTTFGEKRELFIRINTATYNDHGEPANALARGFASEEAFVAGGHFLYERGFDFVADLDHPPIAQAEAALVAILSADAPDQAERDALLRSGIGAEIGRRIFAAAPQTTQLNLAAAAAGGVLTDEQMTAYREGLGWIAAMRTTGATLATALDADYRDDGKWPDLPDSTAELVADF